VIVYPFTTKFSHGGQYRAQISSAEARLRGAWLHPCPIQGGCAQSTLYPGYRAHQRGARGRAAQSLYILPDGAVLDLVYFSILDKEWPGVKKRLEEQLVK
jgi:hypothetical protein